MELIFTAAPLSAAFLHPSIWLQSAAYLAQRITFHRAHRALRFSSRPL